MKITVKAYYHLPGLFEFYELYRVFLPLYREHRDWFYDWCEIGSIYGAPADCIWGGGRAGFGENDPKEVLALMQEYGISARLTFSNSLLKEKHLSDRKCNALCALLEENKDVQNGVIVHSDLLLEYLKKHYPHLYFVSSITKVITDFKQLVEEIRREDFRYVVQICMNIPEDSTDYYYLANKKVLGNCRWEGKQDLLNIVLLGLARELPGQDKKHELHRLLGALLSKKLSQNEKLNIIEKEYDIPLEEDLRKDVSVMCNPSQGIVDDTKAEIILNMFKKGYTLEQIADVTEKSISEIEKIVKKEPAMPSLSDTNQLDSTPFL